MMTAMRIILLKQILLKENKLIQKIKSQKMHKKNTQKNAQKNTSRQE